MLGKRSYAGPFVTLLSNRSPLGRHPRRLNRSGIVYRTVQQAAIAVGPCVARKRQYETHPASHLHASTREKLAELAYATDTVWRTLRSERHKDMGFRLAFECGLRYAFAATLQWWPSGTMGTTCHHVLSPFLALYVVLAT